MLVYKNVWHTLLTTAFYLLIVSFAAAYSPPIIQWGAGRWLVVFFALPLLWEASLWLVGYALDIVGLGQDDGEILPVIATAVCFLRKRTLPFSTAAKPPYRKKDY